MNGHPRRTNGTGRRPDDTTIRIPRSLYRDLVKLRQSSEWFSTMSIASVIQDVVDGYLIREIIHRGSAAEEVRQLRKLAGRLAHENVHTPSRGQVR